MVKDDLVPDGVRFWQIICMISFGPLSHASLFGLPRIPVSGWLSCFAGFPGFREQPHDPFGFTEHVDPHSLRTCMSTIGMQRPSASGCSSPGEGYYTCEESSIIESCGSTAKACCGDSDGSCFDGDSDIFCLPGSLCACSEFACILLR